MKRIRSTFRKGPKISFQILSDLHLEVGQQYSSFSIAPSAPYLILAGDIGRLIEYDNYLSFLDVQVHQFELVFLVLGNHEFYGTTFEVGIATAKRLEQEPNLHGKLKLLHQSRHDIPDSEVTVLGCTLWSNIPNGSEDIVRSRVKDYQKIQDWTVGAHNNAHALDLSWLQAQVPALKAEGRIALVVTHHAPTLTGTSDPKFSDSPWNCAFATDILENGDWQAVHTWVYGHTHYTTEFRKNGVRVVSNQRGYVLPGSTDEREKKTGFDARKTILL